MHETCMGSAAVTAKPACDRLGAAARQRMYVCKIMNTTGISGGAETNTSSTRLPGSSKYPNYPIAGIRIR